MKSLKNRVRLIGQVGQETTVTVLGRSDMVARFPLATHECYWNAKGERQTRTHWHRLVAWGKTAEDVELEVFKGMPLAIEGRLVSRSYQGKDGTKHHVTEVIVHGILPVGQGY